jgi:reverse gyrase
MFTEDLTPEQFKLYQLIWASFVSSQMEEACPTIPSYSGYLRKTNLHAYGISYIRQTIGDIPRFPCGLPKNQRMKTGMKKRKPEGSCWS